MSNRISWDYTQLAQFYVHRPDYADAAIEELLRLTGVSQGSRCCDIGAGTAHLTLKLCERGLIVEAVEPNAAMRAIGQERTRGLEGVSWFDGTAENTGRRQGSFDLVTFGSSFNVTDRAAALLHAHALLGQGGWFACLWNHRDLDDPIQSRIEDIIRRAVPGYGYGQRREDQTAIIAASGCFGPAVQIEAKVLHTQTVESCISAWRSHATLQRQAGDRFDCVIRDVADFLHSLSTVSIRVPYTTRGWAAPRLEQAG
jgi:ubiquinone/menaquinone biosynthesis C-methylase UbiE